MDFTLPFKIIWEAIKDWKVRREEQALIASMFGNVSYDPVVIKDRVLTTLQASEIPMSFNQVFNEVFNGVNGQHANSLYSFCVNDLINDGILRKQQNILIIEFLGEKLLFNTPAKYAGKPFEYARAKSNSERRLNSLKANGVFINGVLILVFTGVQAWAAYEQMRANNQEIYSQNRQNRSETPLPRSPIDSVQHVIGKASTHDTAAKSSNSR